MRWEKRARFMLPLTRSLWLYRIFEWFEYPAAQKYQPAPSCQIANEARWLRKFVLEEEVWRGVVTSTRSGLLKKATFLSAVRPTYGRRWENHQFLSPQFCFAQNPHSCRPLHVNISKSDAIYRLTPAPRFSDFYRHFHFPMEPWSGSTFAPSKGGIM